MTNGSATASAHARLEVASLWIGKELDWLHQLCLASFVHHGHKVTVFYDGTDVAPVVPDGVDTVPAAEVWDRKAHGHGKAPASMVSDLFRLYLLKQTPMMWVDCDVLCVQPLPDDPFHIGKEHGGMVNGAVLRLPPESATLNQLIDWFEDPHFVPHWLNDAQQAKVDAAEPGNRLETAFRLVRPAVGPRALRHTIRAMKEDNHLRRPEVYYPVRGVYSDVFFNPHGGAEESLSFDTLTVHLYASMIRPFHTKHMPAKSSFIAQYAREIGFDIAV
ncbi:hypothetical protein [Tropicibacter naphthalenivorans]|uniref:Mannosyltransferase OCH1 n=1 Tax=Tropicibacter naphthalenivorans TaxID=441103 RepID=A0A0P1GDL5_9RHOB|nr:hypothetical protein [Tropicibacter naphthalenivorans]CUH79820.1 hypothetical protein TRN7648_02663 [Tropicibacter naphthalenivorans]SMC75385.1 hypothetical protein SAMN04488093_103293 [Tropicibacter naphthalenivorans]